MTRRLRLSSRAKRDVASVCEWYDEKDRGLGDRFLQDLNLTFSVVAERPLSFPEVRKGIRATRCDKFPYRVYFEVLVDRVEVLAVYHTARHPKRWNRPDRP